ncbi:MAG: hypothetical protein BWK73_04290 [Thiothrix lacustris]|uniref:Uncharacterized protein n=1 Tax=Thiothrix lacustris TaxID=525917 RepID=A0A1Y1QYC8_9GAMM|nr:MAG: hypothetical protein BWK73_04290 [Thiothrix lacustris]
MPPCSTTLPLLPGVTALTVKVSPSASLSLARTSTVTALPAVVVTWSAAAFGAVLVGTTTSAQLATPP